MGGREGGAGKVKLWIAPDDLKAELAAIDAESIGRLPLGAPEQGAAAGGGGGGIHG